MPDLWPYVPLPEINERLEWTTDILRAKSAEMRYSLHPGQQYLSLRYRHSSDFQDVSTAFSAAPYGDWYVPLWHQASKAGAVASADTALSVEVEADYTDKAVIFASCDDYLIVDIDTVTSTVNLTGAVGQDFTNPTVAPVRLCAPVNGMNAQRTTRKHTEFTVDFRSYESFSPSGASYATLGGLPYFACSAPVVRPLSGSIIQPTEMFDDGMGNFEMIEMRDAIDRAFQVIVAHRDATEKQEFRRFLGDIRGSDGAFWMADWEGSLALSASLPNGAVTATFTAVLSDVADYVGRSLKIGDELRTVASSSDVGGGLHQVGFTALTAAASTARFVRKVRLASERVEIAHTRGFVSTATFGVIEVSE